MECSVYIAVSLDGYIARTDGAVDWLPEPGEDDYGYGDFIKTVDAIVMGRKTFDLALTFSEWPYDKPVVVLTRRPESLPSTLPPRVRAASGTPEEVLTELQRHGAAHVYVDGGVTIQRFLEAGQIDRLIITTVPVLLGSGIPLFGDLTQEIPLRHVRTDAFVNGLVQSEYRLAV